MHVLRTIGHARVVMLAAGPSLVSQKRRTPVAVALSLNDWPTVELLVEAGSDLEARDSVSPRRKQGVLRAIPTAATPRSKLGLISCAPQHERTALSMAVSVGNVHAAVALIQAGASLEAADVVSSPRPCRPPDLVPSTHLKKPVTWTVLCSWIHWPFHLITCDARPRSYSAATPAPPHCRRDA